MGIVYLVSFDGQQKKCVNTLKKGTKYERRGEEYEQEK